jgi:cytochrome c peroxidase
VRLGKVLFYDKILSGNRNISCATCHHALTGTGDGLALPVGEGGKGLGVTRDTGSGSDAIHERVPRNAPHIFNLGAKEFTVMFHDGRVAVDNSLPSGFTSPAGEQLPLGLDNPLAVQGHVPRDLCHRNGRSSR